MRRLVTCTILIVITAEVLSGQQQNLAQQCSGRQTERPPVIAAVLRTMSLQDDRAFRAALDDIERAAKAAADGSPLDASAQYDLAIVFGARSDREGGRRKIAAAIQLQSQAQRVIGLVPDHPGAHYLLARLYAAVRRLDGLTRFLASRMLGGNALVNPPWSQILSLFEVAERGEPCEAEYHYELARLYRDQRAYTRANAELQHVLDVTGDGNSRWASMRRQAEVWLAAGKKMSR